MVDIKNLKIIFILLLIVVIALLGILVLTSREEMFQHEQIILEAIQGTNWPIEQVPLIAQEGLVVKNFGDYTCQANVPSGVTYEEFREFVIELYDAGFKPNKDYGSDNPNLLVPSIEGTEITEITWIAQKDNYYITALWALEGAANEFNIPYEYNFDMNLFINPNSENTHETDISNKNSYMYTDNEDEVLQDNPSGNLLYNSGELIDDVLSEEKIIVSGE